MPSQRLLVVLHVASLLTSLIVITLSFTTSASLSLWCAPVFGIMTFAYHFVLLLLAFTRPQLKPMSWAGTMAMAYILSCCWLAGYIVMIVVRLAGTGGVLVLEILGTNFHFPVGHRILDKWQFVLHAAEWVLLGDLAIRTTVHRRRLLKEKGKLPLYHNRSDPEETMDWRGSTATISAT
ncbi:hypothetical protein CC1G_00152 [Coprinopsis cinerea okayama7|uniref:Uncharacterized protein n=1 Tax=Coprinopsis cinerea (strain Okayama-7 / 130 / ATCC MYA-4618 / FGSC 9003) TaxID=240176 RepID=A8NWY3_COPC7|nr:hypothetical protein CC1G_00152 [Coprinopsis cinerea okayama7\|eukprot:XP_001837016.1 hypothetical protein CC1G_00152 [Coprinopsis cinerea okayama7\